MHKLVESLPEDGPQAIEEMQYRLYVLEKIQKGIDELDRGEGRTDDEARQELSKWLSD